MIYKGFFEDEKNGLRTYELGRLYKIPYDESFDYGILCHMTEEVGYIKGTFITLEHDVQYFAIDWEKIELADYSDISKDDADRLISNAYSWLFERDANVALSVFHEALLRFNFEVNGVLPFNKEV